MGKKLLIMLLAGMMAMPTTAAYAAEEETNNQAMTAEDGAVEESSEEGSIPAAEEESSTEAAADTETQAGEEAAVDAEAPEAEGNQADEESAANEGTAADSENQATEDAAANEENAADAENQTDADAADLEGSSADEETADKNNADSEESAVKESADKEDNKENTDKKSSDDKNSLVVTEETLAEAEANAALAAAGTGFESAITLDTNGESAVGYLQKNGACYYKFTAEKGGEVTIKLSSNTIDEVHYYIYNDDETKIDNSWSKTWARSLEAGTYYIKIAQYDGSGNFNLSVIDNYAADAVNNYSMDTALEISNGGTREGNCSFNNNGRYYSFTMAKAGIMTVQIKKGNSSSVAETRFNLYDNNGKVIKEVWGMSGTYSLSAGKYYIKVIPYDGNGNYTIGVNADYAKNAVDNTSYATAQLLPAGKTLESNLGYGATERWFKIETTSETADTVIKVDGVGNVHFRVYNANKKQEGECYNEICQITLDKGIHYIQVEKYDDSGNFNITVSGNVRSKFTNYVDAKAGSTSLQVGSTTKISLLDGVGAVSYNSSNKDVATVSKKGTIIAKAPGTVEITVTCAGSALYKSGKTTITIEIGKTAIKKLKKVSAGAVKLTWKEKSNVSGYEIQYSTNSSFKGAKTVTVKGAAATVKTLKGLSSNKTYYVRVRSYKSSYYSAWSTVKTVTM